VKRFEVVINRSVAGSHEYGKQVFEQMKYFLLTLSLRRLTSTILLCSLPLTVEEFTVLQADTEVVKIGKATEFFIYSIINCIQSKDHDAIYLIIQINFRFVLDTLFPMSVQIGLTDQTSLKIIIMLNFIRKSQLRFQKRHRSHC
jgi:hypothetical protein